MNIVVLGAGTVGTSIANQLCQQDHSVTVVDIDPIRVRRINEELDVRAILGSGSQSSVLFQAGISTAEICLAVTGDDEVNIIGASMAKAMGVRRAIARVYSPVFRDLSTFDYQEHFNIDRMISLEYLTAMELARGIRNPGTVVVEQFARGGLQVQEIVVGQEGKVTRNLVRDLGLAAHVRLGTIQRENRMWIATAEDQLQVGDRVTVFCQPEDAKSLKSLFKNSGVQAKRVVIAGGGETGLHLARTLEREGFRVMLMEVDADRSQTLVKQLDNTKVIHCDATIIGNLEEERVGSADIFVACTGKDENNLILCVEAKDQGTQQVMATVSREDYGPMISRLGIDHAVSHRQVMAKQMLAFLNEGVVVSRAKLPGGLINIIEVEAHEGSKATETTLANLDLPERCLIVAIIRHDYVRVPGASDRIPAGSNVIILAEDDVVDAALDRFSQNGVS